MRGTWGSQTQRWPLLHSHIRAKFDSESIRASGIP